MIVVADTGPVNYLVLIGQADLLSHLFGKGLMPPAVWEELNDPDTPTPVRVWLSRPPSWLKVQPLRAAPDSSLDH